MVAVNDAMMALMIGARLGEHSLATSAAAPDATLPQLFGAIDGIDRVNRTVGDAAHLLRTAEHHLASMGIPYALGVHGAFMSAVLQMLRDDGNDPADSIRETAWSSDLTQLPLDQIHAYFEERAGEALPRESIECFHLARRIRNRILHFGGDAGSRLPADFRALSSAAADLWTTLAGRSLTIERDGLVALGEGELIAVLAVTRRIAHRVNEVLAGALSREYWATVVVEDYRSIAPQRYGERDRRLRRLRGYARTRYRPLGLTSEEIGAVLPDEESGGSSY